MISTCVETRFVPDVQLEEGQLLQEELTWNVKKTLRFRVGNQAV
jgi:hypothetical protein